MTQPAQCPVDHTDGRRKTWYPHENRSQGVELVDGVWQVRSMDAARQVLRSRATTQAGFNSEHISLHGLRPPILFSDGEPHRTQRAAIARHFAPRTVEGRYQELMERYADQLVDEFRAAGRVDLARLTLRYSVVVAAQVVGLTNSDVERMASRLEAFFGTPLLPPTPTGGRTPGRIERLRDALVSLRGQWPLLAFHLHDVRPAIRARATHRGDDVISHLLDEGCSHPEILIECVTYAAAGMVTTREFISMAVWHLLEDDALRERYLAAGKAERHQVLHEILRLEPIVGHLFRRTTEAITVADGDELHEIPAGALVDLHLRNTNADPTVVGDGPLELCPARELPPRVGDEVMSFGDGTHKCPGSALAIQESDVLLTRLLRLPVAIEGEPRIAWEELIKGYEVRDITLVLEGQEVADSRPPATTERFEGSGGISPREAR